MKLEPDCVRDVLLYLESHLEYIERYDHGLEHNEINFSSISDALLQEHNYSKDSVNYAIEKLLEAGFITSNKQVHGNNKTILSAPISDITWSGHQFLNNIRKQSIWDATKSGAKKIGVTSISAINMIAMEIVKTIVTKPEVINSIMNEFHL